MFEPSTFAERKAAAQVRNAQLGTQRLASMGRTEYTQRDRNGRMESIPAELFYDVDHPTKRYVTIDGVPGLHPLDAGEQRRDEVVSLPPMRRSGRGPSALSLPAMPEPPPRAV